jgi:hypothetical protein
MRAAVQYEGKIHQLEFEEIGPSIYVYKNAIPKEWNVIERIENALAMPGTRFKWWPSLTGFSEEAHNWRTCMDWKINEQGLEPRDEFSADMLDMHEQIITSLKICLEHYKPHNYLAEISYFEAINIVRYGPGQYFKTHTDDGDPYRCTLSAVGYPNDDYEGGELKFPKFNLTYKPKAGDFVLFPSSYAYAHSSEPITNDKVKYSFVIMTDRNSFANRKDSPVLYDPQLLKDNGFNIHGMKTE